jgi:sugar transferase (PEP-CTERM system associated)
MRSNVSRNFLFIFLQDLILIGCVCLATQLRYIYDVFPVFTIHRLTGLGVMYLVIMLFYHYFDLYEIAIHISFQEFFSNLLKAYIAAIVVLTILYYGYPPLKVGDYIPALSVPLGIFASLLFRILWNSLSDESSFTQRVIVLGTGRAAQAVLEDVLRYVHSGYEVLGVIAEGPVPRDEIMDFPILGTIAELPRLSRERPMDMVIVALDDQRGNLPTDELMDLKMAGVRVVDNVNFHELFSGKITLESLRPSWFVFSDGFKVSRLRLFVKRGFDIFAALAGLALAMPLILLFSFLIKVTSRGPLLYKQERVGKAGRTFNLLKFRSMRTDAESATGPVWAAENDARVTAVGRFIRRFRIDEIPQMWNVLQGQMSFVGPRPERPFFVKQLAAVLPYYNQRHVVKPGITGWAQVRYPYGASIEDAREKLQLDLYYIKHTNLGFDLKILLTTTKTLFTKMAR